ncbi:MAG: hypothetical protein VB858_13965, partial [Planctomycetaceae bacterium]
MTTRVTLTVTGQLARIRFAAENGIQLLTKDVRAELSRCLDQLETRPAISVVLFEAAGRTFIAG